MTGQTIAAEMRLAITEQQAKIALAAVGDEAEIAEAIADHLDTMPESYGAFGAFGVPAFSREAWAEIAWAFLEGARLCPEFRASQRVFASGVIRKASLGL
jgi:hypothetical protein